MRIDNDGFWNPWERHANDNQPTLTIIEGEKRWPINKR